MSAKRWIRAFTLIEALIAVMLLSAIALFGVPMYRDAAARGHRILVIEAIREVAWAMAWQSTPSGAGVLGGVSQHASRPTRDDIRAMDVSAYAGKRKVYRIETIQDRDGQIAVRAIPLPGGPMHGDQCGIYELGRDGEQRNVEPGGRPLAAARQQACWRGRG